MPSSTITYIHGTILAMDSNNTIAEALVTQGDKILFVGSLQEALQLTDHQTDLVDLQGKTMLPGFIDSHSHFSRAGVSAISRVSLSSPPVGNINTMSELLQALQQRQQTLQPEQWLLGSDYDDTSLQEQRPPTRQDLDSISATRPIWITHVSNHIGVANSAALKLAGIDETTPDPIGGVIGRTADGKPSGILEENAMFLIRHHLPDVTASIPAALQAANDIYLQVGITTANDGGVGGILGDRADFSDYYQVTDQLQKIRLVLNVYYTRITEYNTMKFQTNKIVRQGVKLLSDGSIQGYTGYLRQPYHTTRQHDANYRGYPWQSREQLCQIIDSLHGQGMQCLVHCNGDAAIDDVLYAFEQAQKHTPRTDCRHVLVHCQMAQEEQLDKMKELGIIPSFFIPHIYYWGDRHRHNFLGEIRAANINPCRWAQQRQLPFTLHCDTPVVPQNPLLTIWSAVNRRTASGQMLGYQEQSITPLEALRAYTINAAHQFFMEKQIGSLEAGKLADMVLLDTNPLTCDPLQIKDIQVLQTIVGGETFYLKK